MSTIGEQLARCQGYVVVDEQGRKLGGVKWVRYETRTDWPDALVVSPSRRLASRRLLTITADRVKHVDEEAQRVIVAAG